ncbi:hypothetical protein M8J77_016309 [Diaphorina citri]|nr:hypothetical protein M8J77_016309 [Diaphorina citri]
MDGDRNDMDEDVMKSTSKGKKRKADDSLDLEGSFTEEEILDMSKAIMEVSTRIESVFQKVLDYPKIKSEIKLEMENLQSMNETLLKDTVMKKMEEKKTQLKKNLQMVTKKYCDRCAIVIENEEEEKRVIIAQLEKGPNLTDEEYATLIEKKWPEEAFTKTKVVTGDPFRTNSEHLIVLYEDIEEDSTLIKMVKDKYPEVKEVIQEEDEDDDGSLPFIENIVNTKKGTRKKRIYLSKVSATEEVRKSLNICRNQMETEQWNSLAVVVSQTKWRKEMRKSLEVCFRQTEVEIEFFVPRGETVVKPPREREEALIIGTNVATYADTMRNIRAVLDPDEVGVKVTSVKTTEDKRVVLVTGKGEAATLQKEIESRVKGIDIKIAGRSQSQVVILDIDASINGKEIEFFIKQSTKVHETEVKSLRLGRAGTQIATVSMPANAAEDLLRMGEVKINWTMCRVKPKVNVMLCYNCLELGHHSDICKEKRNDRKCLNCTQVGHLSKDCTSGSFCATCNREGHRTGSTICPTSKRRIQEATWNTLKNIRKENDDEIVLKEINEEKVVDPDMDMDITSGGECGSNN